MKDCYGKEHSQALVTDCDDYLAELTNPKKPEWEFKEKLCAYHGPNYTGRAWVVYDKANDVECLLSYNTIVSYKVGNRIIRLGTWSHTTSRQQSLYERWY